MSDVHSVLRAPFDPGEVDKLPRRKKLSDGNYTTILLDYVGHANVTDRLLTADPDWTWEPFAVDEQGLPLIVRRGDCLELWIRLTVGTTTRIGVGSVPVEYERDPLTGRSGKQEMPADQDTAKELIGDAIRNAAMRFGVALDLWRKHADGPAPQVVASGPPCPHCGTPVAHNADEQTRGKKPVWSCPNRGCGGGGLRDKNDPSKGNWPWGSYDPNYFTDRETGGEVETMPLEGSPVDKPTVFLTGVALTDLGVSEDQARAELEAMRDNPAFAAGTVPTIRAHVNRACALLAALGEEPDTLLMDLVAEWQRDDPARKDVWWPQMRAGDVLSFAKHVQGFLRAR